MAVRRYFIDVFHTHNNSGAQRGSVQFCNGVVLHFLRANYERSKKFRSRERGAIVSATVKNC